MSVTKKYLNDLTLKLLVVLSRFINKSALAYWKAFMKNVYKGLQPDAALRLDVLIEDLLCVELKAPRRIVTLS